MKIAQITEVDEQNVERRLGLNNYKVDKFKDFESFINSDSSIRPYDLIIADATKQIDFKTLSQLQPKAQFITSANETDITILNYVHHLRNKKFVTLREENGLIELPRQTNGIKVLIEAGHIYADAEISEEQEIGLEVGKRINTMFTALGYDTMNMIFVDNYNSDKDILSINDYIDFAQKKGFVPDKIVFEADLVSDARTLLHKLYSEGNAIKSDTSNEYRLAKGNKMLYDGEKYSCILLDATLTQKKLEMADVMINVLPVKYKSEQKGMATILKKIGEYDPTRVLKYFTEDTRESLDDKVASVGRVLKKFDVMPTSYHR